jgi:L-lactate dehydrogenase complex protein LldF
MPQWEDLRQAASELRLHTLAHLDVYLEQLERQVRRPAATCTGRRTPARAREIVLEIAARHGVRRP